MKKKIIQCIYCNSNMKVPEMVNKTLRVYCPNCGRSFEVYFKKKKFKFSDILKSFKKAT